MEKSVFDISEFNIIQDDENYYVFRALNNGDHRDISEGITSNENGISRVRTDRERFEEEKGNAKYDTQSEISLEEVWDHIKIRYLKETNCISLSGNANVSIDYGQGYNQEYVMVKVPKKEMGQVYNAGQYMLEEISQKIDEALKKIPEDSNVLEIIRKIDTENSHKNIRAIVADSYESAKSITGKYTGTGNNVKSKISVSSRLDKKQYFTEEQQLEYSKIIGKLTVLETHGILRSILPTKLDNSSLIRTIGSAFSSGELIHYGDIEKAEMTEVPKEMMDLLSLVQQLKDKDVNNDKVKDLERRVIELINGGYKFTKDNGQLSLSNGSNSIKIRDLDDETSMQANQPTNLKIEDMYELTKGRISYERAKTAVEFETKLSQSRLKAIQYADVIRALMGEESELAEKVEKECYTIDKDIISRQNHRGVKIAESVNIGLTGEHEEFVSNDEQIKLITAIQGLNQEQLRRIIDTNGMSLEQDILERFLEKKEEISENQYFAEAIVDGINFEKIYKTTTGEKRTITEQERKRLVDRLNGADCKKLYNAFINAGINTNDISGYIINLLMDNGYKGYTLQELASLDNLDEIIAKNTKNLNCRIQALRLDKTLGIEDDAYVVPETSIRLRDYQQDTVQNIDRIHENKRFAGMVLPTGAGKSFVAMTEMMKYKNSNIIFIAPQNTILNQFQNHILKNILDKKVITDDEMEKLRKEGKEIPEDRVRSKDAKKVIEEAFPHLKMFCYATLSSRDEEWLKSQDADFIILDELHRAGAATWKPQIQKLLENNPNAKILGMTATPVRDMDHEDMARVLAEMSGDYTEKELIQKRYLASEMHVLEAMQDNIVVSPKIITFDYTLGESEEYQEVKRMMQEEQDLTKKEELNRIYKEMTAIIQKSEKKGMNGILAENIKKKNGRYIVFLPNNKTELSTEEYIKTEIEKVKEYFKDVNQNIQTGYLLSNRENAKSENAVALEEFENSDSDELKLLFALDMLNEGVHVDGIDGAVMLRPISENSKILYLQQIGRCIFSLDPNNPISDEDRPVIFDVYNNYLAQNMDREANKTTPTSDLQRLQSIVNWIERHNGYIPNVDSEDTKEARRAVILKNIQEKYKRYFNGIENKNLSESEIYEIQQILELGKSIELWDLQIQEIIVSPEKTNIIRRNDTFKVTGTQREFVELFKKAKEVKKDRKLSDGLRRKNILYVLDVLSEYGIEISNETIGPETILKDLFVNLPPQITKTILEEADIEPSWKIGEEYNFVKKQFFDGESIFLQYSIEELRKYGMFESFTFENSDGEKINISSIENDFVNKGPYKFINVNIKTGTLWDELGYNVYGLDRFGFSKEDGLFYDLDINGKKLRTEGKTRDYYGYDVNGINERGYGRNGNYYEKQEDGTWKDTGRLWNDQGFDENGDYWEKQEDGTFKNTMRKFGKDGYSIYGIDEYGFSKEDGLYYGVNRKGEKVESEGKLRDFLGYDVNGVNEKGYGRNGNYYEKQEDGTWKDTGRIWNRQSLDENGYYWEEQENGTYKQTMRKFGNDGYSEYGINEYGFSKEDRLYYGVDRNGKKRHDNGELRDPYGYDANGINQRGYGRNGNYYKKEEDGTWKDTGRTCDDQGFDEKGDYWEEQEDGTFINTRRKFGKDGYSLYGVNEYGFSKEDGLYYGVDRKGKTKYDKGVSRDFFGYDVNGINERGYGRNGNYYEKQEDGSWEDTGKLWNNQGFDKNGDYWEEQEDGTFINTGRKFGKDGYSLYGVNEYGFSKEDGLYYGVDARNGRKQKRIGTIRNPEGYDINGIDENGYGRNGNYYERQEDGSWKDTGRLLNNQGFDKNGDYWEEQEDGTFINTGRKFGKDGYSLNGIDKFGFSKEDGLFYGVDKSGNKARKVGQENKPNGLGFDGYGYYYERQEDGTYKATGLKYNRYGFKKDLTNIITKTTTDIRQFDIFGKCIANKSKIYDENGFKQDGTYMETGELYHNGFNAFGVDKNGKNKEGKEPIEITFTKEYVNGILKGKAGEVLKKYNIKSMNRVNIMLYTGTEMFPKIKQAIFTQIMNYQKMIQQREEKIQQLETKKTENMPEIERLRKENAVLKQRISYMNPMQEL